MPDSPQIRRWVTLRTAAVAVALGCAVLVLFTFDPLTSSVFPPCPLHALTGLLCPGCGSVRAMHRLVHGDLCGALSMNPLMVASLPFLALLACRRSWCYRPWLPWLSLGILVAYGALRNVPIWPFVILAPRMT
jgi:hypothetical protein